jgi:glutamate-1-semialdehyde 2,1-aminomutase
MTNDRPKSRAIFEAAQRIVPGGVNSPVRAWKAVGGTPVHAARGQGAWLFDVDGNRYVDLVMSYGPLILGHAPKAVVAAITEAAQHGTAFGAPTERELKLAQRICEFVPGAERVRLVNSGTEATMSALRVARAATGRDFLLKFDGNYHGHGDSFLVKAGSGALTLGAPDSPGVPRALAELTLVAPYNDLAATRAMFALHRNKIAAVFVEPIAGNIGLVLPEPGFLAGLRELCDEFGTVLVFDEVMTGFRVARGGASELYGIRPDLVTLGKVIGGGLPIGAYAGRDDLMRQVAPLGKVYQAGTLSGNPLATAAGLATLDALADRSVYDVLERLGRELQEGLERAARDAGVSIVVGRAGSMICPYFASGPLSRLEQVMASDRERWTRFFHAMLAEGVHLPPSPFESWFLSTAHAGEPLEQLVRAAKVAMRAAR